jgi:excinuclease ABC subunit C
MQGLFAQLTFNGFGVSQLAVEGETPSQYEISGDRTSRLRVGVRRECSRRPGVYGMVDAAGELVYVGKAKCLRTRLLSYFRPKGRDPKAGKIVSSARRLVWEPAACEFAALLRELELIRRWRPRFNVQGQPRRRRRCYVCVGREPAPHVFLAPRPVSTATICFGPVPSARTAGEAVRRLNDWFRLRDCPTPQTMAFADQHELFPVVREAGCIRLELGTCLGPCAAACTRPHYTGAVRAAVRFLQGRDSMPLDDLQREMLAAAQAQAFERAGALRDKWKALSWLYTHLERLREAGRRSCVYPRRGADGLERWHLIHRGRVRAVVFAPTDHMTQRRAAAALQTVYTSAAANDGPTSLEEIDGVLLVASWFRRRPEEAKKIRSAKEMYGACRPESLEFRL